MNAGDIECRLHLLFGFRMGASYEYSRGAPTAAEAYACRLAVRSDSRPPEPWRLDSRPAEAPRLAAPRALTW